MQNFDKSTLQSSIAPNLPEVNQFKPNQKLLLNRGVSSSWCIYSEVRLYILESLSYPANLLSTIPINYPIHRDRPEPG